MSENTISSDNFDLDIANFGEPTQETLLAFAETIESLKRLALQEDELTVIRLDDDPNPDVPKIDGVLNHYSVPPSNEPDYKGPRFNASIYDAEPEVMAQVYGEFDHIVDIQYTDQDGSISYTQAYSKEPMLYVRGKYDRVKHESTNVSNIETSLGALSFGMRGTPELMREVHARLEERREAHGQGLDRPTEGTMKQLIEIINQELERRNNES